jgi:hypothetical protein
VDHPDAGHLLHGLVGPVGAQSQTLTTESCPASCPVHRAQRLSIAGQRTLHRGIRGFIFPTGPERTSPEHTQRERVLGFYSKRLPIPRQRFLITAVCCEASPNIGDCADVEGISPHNQQVFRRRFLHSAAGELDAEGVGTGLDLLRESGQNLASEESASFTQIGSRSNFETLYRLSLQPVVGIGDRGFGNCPPDLPSSNGTAGTEI